MRTMVQVKSTKNMILFGMGLWIDASCKSLLEKSPPRRSGIWINSSSLARLNINISKVRHKTFEMRGLNDKSNFLMLPVSLTCPNLMEFLRVRHHHICSLKWQLYLICFFCKNSLGDYLCPTWCSFRSRGRPLPALVRLLRGLLLCSPFLDQNLQTSAEAGRGVHQAEEKRLSRLGNLPALWLRQGPLLQGVERRHLLIQVQTPHVPEDLKLEQQLSVMRPLPSISEGFSLEKKRKKTVGLWLFLKKLTKDRTNAEGSSSIYKRRPLKHMYTHSIERTAFIKK